MWYFIPCPSSASAPAPECSIADFLSRCASADSTREPCAVASGTLTPRPYSWIGWKNRGWIRRLSGLTLTPSQQDDSMEKWLQSLPEFPARVIPSQASGRSPRTTVTSGPRPARYFDTPGQASSPSKMSEDCLFPTGKKDSKPASAGLSTSWPKTGGWDAGGSYELPTLEPITDVSGYFSWPTADCNTSSYRNGHNGHENLREATANWPTPTSRDYKDGNSSPLVEVNGLLGREVLEFPSSPPPETTMPSGCAYSELILLLCRLFGVETEEQFRAVPKSLNPKFVEWLMGWPLDHTLIGRTGCGFAGTALCISRRPSPIASCG